MNPIMTVRVKKQVQDKLKITAMKMGLSRNDLVVQILCDWIKKNGLD